jgi:putative (di)nucleoside polyphosphate hydrolase
MEKKLTFEEVKQLKIDKKLPYRQGVIAIVVNDKNQILLVQARSFKETEWKFPSGGLKEHETHKQALERELKEELGTNLFKTEKKSNVVNVYDWTPEFIFTQYNKKNVLYRGQQQEQYLVRFIGQNHNIQLENEELRTYKWVEKEDLETHLLFEGQYLHALKTLKDLGI